MSTKFKKIISLIAVIALLISFPLKAQAIAFIPIIVGLALSGAALYNFMPGADKAIIWLVDTLVNGVLGFLITFFANLINTFIPLQNLLLKIEAIKVAWAIFRDFSNIFFILLLIITAFATIFNRENYTYQKLLPKIIIAALLINFSLVIFQTVVDVLWYPANIFITAIGNPEQIGTKIAEPLQIHRIRDAQYLGGSGQNAPSAGFIFTVMKGILFLLMAFALGWIALALLIRIPILMGLAIFSPIAWISYAFPPIKSAWDKWWSNLLYWGIIPVFYLGVIYFVLFLNNQIKDFLSQVPFQGEITAFWPLEWADTILMLINLGLLMGGIYLAQNFAKSSGAMGTKLIGYNWMAAVGGVGAAGALGLWRGTGIPGGIEKATEEIRGKWFKEPLERREEAIARGLGRIAGVTPVFAAQKAILDRAGKATSDLEDKLKTAKTPDEEKRIIEDAFRKGLSSPEGMAGFLLLARKGQLDKGSFDNAAKQFEKMPLVMTKIFSEWKEGKFGGLSRPEDLITILKDARTPLEAKRIGYNFAASDDGKRVVEKMSFDDFKTMYETLGGRATKDGRAAKKFVGEVRPTVVAEYNLRFETFDDPKDRPKDIAEAVLKQIQKTGSKDFTKYQKSDWQSPEFKAALKDLLGKKAETDIGNARKYAEEVRKWLIRESKDEDELRVFNDATTMAGI